MGSYRLLSLRSTQNRRFGCRRSFAVRTLGSSCLCSPRLFGSPATLFLLLRKACGNALFALKIPVFSTLITGVAAAVLALLVDGEALMDLISIGTLVAFCMVSAGLLFHRYQLSTCKEHPPSTCSLCCCLLLKAPTTWISVFTLSCLIASTGTRKRCPRS